MVFLLTWGVPLPQLITLGYHHVSRSTGIPMSSDYAWDWCMCINLYSMPAPWTVWVMILTPDIRIRPASILAKFSPSIRNNSQQDMFEANILDHCDVQFTHKDWHKMASFAHKSGDRRQLLGYQVRVSRYLKKSPDSGPVTLQFWAVIRYYKCYKPIYHHFWCWCCCLRSSCATSALRDSKWAKTLEPTFIWNISIWIIHHIDICMWVICMYIYIFFTWGYSST
jgi:hypothetical protein